MFSGFGEVSELLKQIIAESDEGVPEGVVLEESDEDLREYLRSILGGEEEEGD